MADSLIEVTYVSPWTSGSNGEGIPRSPWRTHGTDGAFSQLDRALGLLRLVTGRHVPVVFSDVQTVPLPWVRNRMYHRPTTTDIHRRFSSSPIFMRVVEPAPLSSEEGASLASLAATLDKIAFDSQVQLALWVFNRERDYINLYKCYEIVYDGAGRRRTNDWMGTANAQALHTHGE